MGNSVSTAGALEEDTMNMEDTNCPTEQADEDMDVHDLSDDPSQRGTRESDILKTYTNSETPTSDDANDSAIQDDSKSKQREAVRVVGINWWDRDERVPLVIPSSHLWHCDCCTFANTTLNPTCEMCGSLPPKIKPTRTTQLYIKIERGENLLDIGGEIYIVAALESCPEVFSKSETLLAKRTQVVVTFDEDLAPLQVPNGSWKQESIVLTVYRKLLSTNEDTSAVKVSSAVIQLGLESLRLDESTDKLKKVEVALRDSNSAKIQRRGGISKLVVHFAIKHLISNELTRVKTELSSFSLSVNGDPMKQIERPRTFKSRNSSNPFARRGVHVVGIELVGCSNLMHTFTKGKKMLLTSPYVLAWITESHYNKQTGGAEHERESVSNSERKDDRSDISSNQVTTKTPASFLVCSTTVRENLNPVWNTTIGPLPAMNLRKRSLHIEVRDSNFGIHREIGFTNIDLGYDKLNLDKGTVVTAPLSTQGTVTVKIHAYAIQPGDAVMAEDAFSTSRNTVLKDGAVFKVLGLSFQDVGIITE